MPTKKDFLPTQKTLAKFVDKSFIPEDFLYGNNEDQNVGLVVAQVLKYHKNINFMEAFEKAYQDLVNKKLAIKYYTPQLYQKMLSITNEEWHTIVHSNTGLSILGNLALRETLSTSNFNNDIKEDINLLIDNSDYYPNTGVINLDHLKQN